MLLACFLSMAAGLGFDGLEEGEEVAVGCKPWGVAFREGRFLRCLFFNRTLAR